jgi:hypothetical protein
VLSREDPPGSTVAEGTVDVAPFDDVQVELVPRQSKGRRRGKHQVAVDNNGNIPTTVQVTAQDEEEALDFKMDHSVATIEPGAAAFIRVVAVPEKRFFKGADRQHPFVVTVVPNNASPVATRGTMSQRQLLPSWLLPAVAILAVAVVAAIVLYETLLKPTIKSEARDAASRAAKSQNSSLASKASAAESQAAAANVAAKKAQADASEAKKSAVAGGGGKPAQTPTGATAPGGADIDNGQATAFTIETDAAPTTDPTTFTVSNGPKIPANKILVITYMILQNPNGDQGTLRIQRGASETLLTEGLANFRDLDHPFQVEPLLFTPADPVQVSVNCTKTTTGNCHPSVLFTGRLVNKKAAP